tara:strand:+ start:446 stop:3235 length:2790 start_codon:yes stop_codon:yes gene_type:complete
MKTDIHIFSPGTQTSAQGVTREFTKKDLAEIAQGYNPSVHEAPIRVGHEDSDKVPSWGWVKDVKMKGEDLYAEVEFSPLMEDYVKNGLYKKVSASFYSPESKINPDEGRWSLRHVAMLGAQPPAVKGLKGFAYSEESDGEGVLDFAVTLTPDQVFDKELGPTLKVDLGPLEMLKQKLNEARSEMSAETKDQELEKEALSDSGGMREFAEGKLKMKLKKKVASGKEGSEGSEDDEGDEDDDEAPFKEGLKADAAKDKKMAAKDVSEAKYDSKRGKRKRAGELMADADQDDEDADEDTVNSKEQGYDDKLDDSLGAKNGKKKQSMKDRRDESEGMEKSKGKRKFSGDKSMDMSEEDEADFVEDMALRDGRPYSLGGSPEVHAKGYSNQMEQDVSEGAGPVVSKMKGGATGAPMGDKEAMYAEITIPDGVDADEYREGFEEAVAAYVEALEIGGDVEYSEDEEVSPSFDTGVRHGLEYAMDFAARVEDDGKMVDLKAPPKDGLSNLPPEEGDLPAGMQKSGKRGMKKKGVTVTESGDYKEGLQDIKKVKRGMPSKKSMSGTDPDEKESDEREYEEPTFDPMNKKGSTKKRGSDGLNSSDTGVKTTKGGEIFYDEEQHAEELPDGGAENRDTSKGATDSKKYKSKTKGRKVKVTKPSEENTFGRFTVGQPEGDSGVTGRNKVGKAGKSPADGGEGFGRYAVAKNGEQEANRMSSKPARSSEQAMDRNSTGKSKSGDFGGLAHTKMVNTGGPSGSGSAVKSPRIRVMDIKAGQTPKQVAMEYSEQFSELTDRLAQLEAANAQLVQEKHAAEKRAHRLQLEEFTESLYAHGKLTAAVMDQSELVDFVEGLEYGTLEFSEGESPATKLMDLLAKLPSSVSFSEIAGGFNEDAIPFENLDPHEQALQIAREEGLEYSEALKRTLFTIDAAHVGDEEV